MSSPMYEAPAHSLIGVDEHGDGPIDENDPSFVGYVCWCGDNPCYEVKR